MAKMTDYVAWFLAVMTATAPIYVAYDLLSKGSIPQKQVELWDGLQFNALTSLAPLGNRATVRITVGDETIDNLVVAYASLTNIGQSPILPSDFFENLAVSVKKPYKILTVEPDNGPPRLTWSRVSDERFEAKPALLNPGDRVGAQVYLTDTSRDAAARSKPFPDVPIEWSARIANLRSFTKPSTSGLTSDSSGIVIYVAGWGIPCLLAIALSFFGSYIYLLRSAGIVRSITTSGGAVLAFASLLSFAAAESLTHFIFGGYIPALFPALNPINVIVLAVHVAFVVFLLWRVKRKVPNQALHPTPVV